MPVEAVLQWGDMGELNDAENTSCSLILDQIQESDK